MSDENEIREYDKVKYSLKDLWMSNSKIVTGVVFLMLIYGRFTVVETTQQSFIENQQKQMELLERELDHTRTKCLEDNKILEERLEDKLDAAEIRFGDQINDVDKEIENIWKEYHVQH